jgi:tyrosine-protein phosphatase SIW14
MKASFKFLQLFCRYLWLSVKFSVVHSLGMILGTIEVLIFIIRQKFFKNSLPNYDVVDHQALHRGGQPDDLGVAQLKKQGIKTIISLRGAKKKWLDSVKSVNIPFNPYKPSDKIVIEFLKVIYNKEHHPIFIHCFHGADRTGTLCAIYRIVVQKWDKEKAIEEMKKYGFHWWHKNLIDYIRNLDIDNIKIKAGITD